MSALLFTDDTMPSRCGVCGAPLVDISFAGIPVASGWYWPGNAHGFITCGPMYWYVCAYWSTPIGMDRHRLAPDPMTGMEVAI